MRFPFGSILAVMRAERGWTHAELAARSALAAHTVRRVETISRPDQMHRETFRIVASWYERTPADLVHMWRVLNGANAVG